MLKTLFGVQTYWLGTQPESTNQRVYFANHQSHLDTIILMGALPASERLKVRPVAAADFWNRPLFSWLAKYFRAILIDRKNITRKNNPMMPIAQALEAKNSLIIYPEGTRGDSGQIADFKAGIYHIAQLQPGLVFVPTYLSNLNRILPKGEFLPIPISAAVYFGAEVTLLPNEERWAFVKRCQDALVQLQQKVSVT